MKKLLRTLIDNLPVNVYIKDTESRKVLINKAECEYLGVKDPKEVIGKNDFDLYPFKTAEKIRAEDLKVMNTLELLLVRKQKKLL